MIGQPDQKDLRFLFQIGVLTFLTFVGGYFLTWHFGVQPPVIFSTFVVLFLAALFFGAAFALIGFVLWMAIRGEGRPLRRLGELPVWSPEFVVKRVLPPALTFLFLGAVGPFKSLIPYVHPFVWDGAFSDLDRLIFGTDPWRLTHAFIGPTGTRALDIVYGLWFPAWVLSVVYFGCFAREAEQKRFLSAFFAVWIVEGIIFATIFSSAGPCYLQMIHHADASRYAGLFPLNAPGASAAQAMLAASFKGGDIGAFKGISAMPSVHVGVAFLLVLASRRWWRVMAWIFWTMIFLASVHLGWHYASDGIVASLLTALCWKLARYGNRQVSERSSAGLSQGAGHPGEAAV